MASFSTLAARVPFVNNVTIYTATATLMALRSRRSRSLPTVLVRPPPRKAAGSFSLICLYPEEVEGVEAKRNARFRFPLTRLRLNAVVGIRRWVRWRGQLLGTSKKSCRQFQRGLSLF
jgi:hypothetical protein